MPEPHATGFVSLLGRPNAGKSTLLNALVGMKVAIVADKPQTTRMAVQGVWTAPGAQAVFLDTPGIHRAGTLFNRRMMAHVRAALEERDLLLYVADATQAVREEDEHALDLLRKTQTPVFLVLNKIDLVREKQRLLPVIARYRELFDFAEYIPVSAETGAELEELKSAIAARLPPGPALFPADYVTDQPERVLASELIREKIISETRQEVPHSVAVVIEQWKEAPKLTRVSAVIFVEREGQKAIVIGAHGSMLKRIGMLAREEMEHLLGRKFFLELFVKVRDNWRENPEFLAALDWR